MGKCVLCNNPSKGPHALFCARCGKAYDRWNATADGTTNALVLWVANGARYWERKRLAECRPMLGGETGEDGRGPCASTKRIEDAPGLKPRLYHCSLDDGHDGRCAFGMHRWGRTNTCTDDPARWPRG